MSKLEWIESFITLAEENSFVAAAKKQRISTAAISRQIAQLETTLKTELLKRTTRKVSLTEIGNEYYQHCKKMISELADAENMIASSQKEARGILSITASRYFAIRHIMPRLDEFMKQNPKLQIKFELAERIPDISQEGIDILFGLSVEGAPEWVRKKFATTRYVLCASKKYLKKYGTPQTPADLTKHNYITHSIRTPSNILQFKNNKEVFLNPILYLNDSKAMRECALRHMGIVKLHDYVVNDALEEGRLIEILREYQEPQIPVYLYYQQSRYLQPKIRRFIDFYTSSNAS